MPIYTGTGDDGTTGLFDNRRVPKDNARIQAYGTIDELNSYVGLLRCETIPIDFSERLERIQNALFEIGADLATPGSQAALPLLQKGIQQLEQWIDESEAQLPRLKTFVLPGGHPEAALLHVLRTIARRAERRYWTVRNADHTVATEIGVYLNRLSDLFFSWARWRNQERGVEDVAWKSER